MNGIMAENGLRSNFRVYNLTFFHGGSVPQISYQMRVTHALGVPMLCPRNLLILATPLLYFMTYYIHIVTKVCMVTKVYL